MLGCVLFCTSKDYRALNEQQSTSPQPHKLSGQHDMVSSLCLTVLRQNLKSLDLKLSVHTSSMKKKIKKKEIQERKLSFEIVTLINHQNEINICWPNMNSMQQLQRSFWNGAQEDRQNVLMAISFFCCCCFIFLKLMKWLLVKQWYCKTKFK